MKILVVDDQPGMRITLDGILKRRGHEVVTAEGGCQAIEELKKNNIDVVLMDIKMPGMDGVETFLKMKEIDPKISVFMMTAFAVDVQIKKALEEGALGIIYKPFDIEKTLSMIENCVRSRRS